jgi:hypothetical protein
MSGKGLGRFSTIGAAAALAALLVSGGSSAQTARNKTATFSVRSVQVSTSGQVTVNSQVWVTATQARAVIQNPLKGEAVFLITGGYLYQLDPAKKRGVRFPLPPEVAAKTDNFSFLISRFAFDASKALARTKVVRQETVAGYVCDVHYASEEKAGARRTITVWMPRKMEPRIPLKAVMSQRVNKPGATLNDSLTITLSNLKLNSPIPATTFRVPTGYEIKTETGSPGQPRPGR